MEIKMVAFGDPNWEAVRNIRDLVFVQEQEVSEEEEYDEFEAGSRHFLAVADGQAAGTARWRTTGKGVKLERFAVRKEFRGRGLGRSLVKAVLADVFACGHENACIYLHAQVQAIPFYAGLGFEARGEEFSEAGILHRKMEFSGS